MLTTVGQRQADVFPWHEAFIAEMEACGVFGHAWLEVQQPAPARPSGQSSGSGGPVLGEGPDAAALRLGLQRLAIQFSCVVQGRDDVIARIGIAAGASGFAGQFQADVVEGRLDRSGFQGLT